MPLIPVSLAFQLACVTAFLVWAATSLLLVAVLYRRSVAKLDDEIRTATEESDQ